MKSRNVLRELCWVREGFSWMVSQGEPWKLETRLDCVKLAKEQDMREGGLYTVQGSAQTSGYKGKTESPDKRDSY